MKRRSITLFSIATLLTVAATSADCIGGEGKTLHLGAQQKTFAQNEPIFVTLRFCTSINDS